MYISSYGSAIIPSTKASSIEHRALPFFVDIATTPNLSSVHWHDYTQLWYTVSGSYEHTINGVTTRHTAGDLALILPYTIHSSNTINSDFEKLKLIRISIYEDLFTNNIMPFRTISYKSAVFDRFALAPLLKFSGKAKEKADILFNEILSEFSRQYKMNKAAIFTNISKIFELLVQNGATSANSSDIAKASEFLDVISDATNVISRDFSKNIQLSEIAKQSLMSQRTFARNFNFFTGQTFISYYNKVKLSNVLHMLFHTNKTLSEIADECGFYDSVHLSHFFKNILGIPPIAFKSRTIDYNKNHGLHGHMRQMEKLAWLGVMTDEEVAYFRNCAVGIPTK